MIKKYAFVFAFLCAVVSGFGQYQTGFEDATKDGYAYGNVTLNGIQWNMTEALIGDLTNDWKNDAKSARMRGHGSSAITMIEDKSDGIGAISFSYRRFGTDTQVDWKVEYSTNGGALWTQIGSNFTSPDDNNIQAFNETINITGDVRIRIKRATETGASNRRLNIDDIVLTDYSSSTDEVDWCNLQWPPTGNINQCGEHPVYARVWEPGVTDAVGQGAGITAWIGYNTDNTDPSTTGWTWVEANYNGDNGNDDEYWVNLGEHLDAVDTYYYASRFQLNGGPFTYGGYNAGGGGFWDGTTNVSGTVTTSNEQVNFCNVDYPKTATIVVGDDHTVYAQVYEPGITDAVGQGLGITAWIGYNAIGENNNPVDDNGWTWVEATYDSDFGNNDQYYVTFGSSLTAGTYYYASRFQINCNEYSYGGIQSDNVGNFWDATNNNGILIVNNPPLADVVITEIMYNTSGTDDEWIEICNVSGSPQNLSGYKVNVNSNDLFTFPIGSIIADGDCITVSLGSDGYGTYNDGNGTIGYCPFTPDYGIDAGTNDTNKLINDPGDAGINISLLSPTNVVADIVNYDDADGADGNGASLHVTDIGLDNSDTSTNWQEVVNGGSAGVNLLVSSCSPIAPEIDVERNTSASIPSGSAASNGHNTIWATTNVGDSANKTFFVRNEGFANLTITSMTSNNTADFELVNIPTTFPVVLAPGDFIEFEIEFSPDTTIPVTKNGIITIINSDADEGTYAFNVRGTAGCPLYTGNLFPASGPVGTEITITSNESQNLAGATATLNGVPLTVLSSSTNELVVQVPNTVTTGGALVVSLSGGCSFTNGFIFIDQAVSDCEGTGGSNASDIFISQVTDSGDDSFTYIELYNGTGSTVNINNYSIALYNNGRSTPVNSNFIIDLNNVNLPDGNTYVLAVGLNNMNCATEHNPSGLADQQYNVAGVSLNFSKDGDNTIGHDHLRLYNAATHIDSWGVYEDESWATSLNLGGKAANFMRRNDVTAPNAVFTVSDWVVQDWGNTCADLDYSDIGSFNFQSGIPPTVGILNPPISSCDLTTSLTVTASEGFAGGNSLVFQWYYSAPGEIGWTVVPDNATYDDVTTNTLQILNVLTLNGYQYYCEVREDDATCFVASNAVKLDVPVSTWAAGAWTPAVPDINTIAIIDGNYNTGTDGSFSACQLVLNSSHLLTIGNGTYVEVQNYATINGDILVETHGAFVQRANLNDGFVLNSGGTASVNKSTAIVHNWYDYTYWSSPVFGATVGATIDIAPANRRFYYEAANYLDVFEETGNNNATDPGHDDVDDNGDDWQPAPAGMVMAPGQGFAATVLNSGPFPGTRQITFIGPYNTGTITTPIYWNGNNGDNDWNLIGNPYPSAISFIDLYNANTSLVDGAAYLWSQASEPSADNNGNENQNFSMADYAIISVGSGNTAGGDEIVPNDFIPSGQSFFIKGLDNGDLTFTNAMRMADATSNNQFFRTIGESNRLWINLTSDNGVFNQILVAYVNGATASDDGMAYDAPRNLSTGVASILYSIIPDSDLKFAIQGKDPSSLTLDEVIPLGFYTAIDVPTLYTFSIAQMEGNFLAENPVYVRDYLLNVTHNLSASDYTFTSETGAFNDRFEIVFRETALSVGDHEIPASGLSIIELQNGTVKFTVGHGLNIQAVEIMDLLGRRLYNLKGNSPVEIFDLSNLSQAAYIAKVTLSNGQVLTKRAIKRR